MTFFEMIRDIRKASERDKLVIFIGAGVSVNSGYKLWDDLIGIINSEIGYTDKNKHFTTAESLTIPQYLYNTNKEKYCEIIINEYSKIPLQSNPIIDTLLSLNPVHIITTNFDLLIEKSLEEGNVFGSTVHESIDKYSIIRCDDDFIYATKSNYLIKMHGDVETLNHLILKEDDYLNYSSSHALIETYIKSLFVNHTFLFVGYGLGDYNIKLIMSWVDSMLKRQSEADEKRFSYYFINADTNKLNEYEKDHYVNKNIYVIESSDIPEDFTVLHSSEEVVEYDDPRGNNLLRACNFIIYGRDDSIAELLADLSVFDNIECITVEELLSVLDCRGYYDFVYDSTLYYYNNNFAFRLKMVIDEVVNNSTTKEAKHFSSLLIKSGVDSLCSHDSDNITNLDKSGYVQNGLYESVINFDFDKLNEFSSSTDTSDVKSLLRTGYALALLGYTNEAEGKFSNAISLAKENNDIFHLLIGNLNLTKVCAYAKHTWFLLKSKLSDEHKAIHKTLFDYMDDSNDLFINSVETLKKLENKLDKSNRTISLKNRTELSKIRYHIHQTQRYFIQNCIYLKGYSGMTMIVGNRLKALDNYVEILILLHSSNIKMTHDERSNEENILKVEDLYILITHPDGDRLKHLLKRHNTKHLPVESSALHYFINVYHNHLSAFKYDEVIRFKFAADIKNILQLIQVLDFSDEQYLTIFEIMTMFLEKIILAISADQGYIRTVYHEVMLETIECTYFIIRSKNERIKGLSLKNMLIKILSCFSQSDEPDDFQKKLFFLEDISIIMNLSNGLKYYYSECLPEDVTDKFLSMVMERVPPSVKQFIIELYPVLDSSQKEKYREFVNKYATSIEPLFIRFGIINGAIDFNDDILSKLITFCRLQVRSRIDETQQGIVASAMHNVLRLVENDCIPDIEPFREFIGHYDLFDFVCFPDEFDYTAFDTQWSSWLTLDKYRKSAFKSSLDVLKQKYEETMNNGPTEMEKEIYYKYFHSEFSPFDI